VRSTSGQCHRFNGCFQALQELLDTLQQVKHRGQPYWWLSADKCCQCGQWWLVAQESYRDVLSLRRLSPEIADRLVKDDLWPSDFDKYRLCCSLASKRGDLSCYKDPVGPPPSDTYHCPCQRDARNQCFRLVLYLT